MSYEVKGTIKKVLQIQFGESKATGKEWKKVSFVVANNDGYEGREQIYCFDIFGAEKVDNFIKFNQEGATVNVKFDIRTNAYQGKYFTNLAAFHVQSGEAVEQAVHHDDPMTQGKDELPNFDEPPF